ncbi:hypothetical protein QYE76_022822 [Lolium multiflorum]|uniref:Uncharacterized protein n=1 Tax=Lolium multiflorum TaxID=4521 RepID=A0AAD8RAK7_LOLMU|nr:hypothetical protein QYE76_022822 [Lolium multiflorum]
MGCSCVTTKLAINLSHRSLQDETDATGRSFQPRASWPYEGHGEPIYHDTVIPTGGEDGHGVQLKKLDWVGGVVVVRREFRSQLVGPSNIAHALLQEKACDIVDLLSPDAHVESDLCDVEDGMVLLPVLALQDHAGVLRSADNFQGTDLAYWPPGSAFEGPVPSSRPLRCCCSAASLRSCRRSSVKKTQPAF